jgi:hypothetical protein
MSITSFGGSCAGGFNGSASFSNAPVGSQLVIQVTGPQPSSNSFTIPSSSGTAPFSIGQIVVPGSYRVTVSMPGASAFRDFSC